MVLPPNSRPISGKLALVRVLHRYIATWRGNEMFLELLLDLRSAALSHNELRRFFG